MKPPPGPSWRRAAILLGAGVVLLALPLQGQAAAGIPVGSPAPAVKVHDLDGNPVDLGQWIGRKPVLLEFWATWCDQCEQLLPRLQAAHEGFGGAVEFLAINVVVNQSPEKVRRYVIQHGVPGRVLYDDQAVSIRAYLAPATSFVVIIGKDGKVAYTGLGGEQDINAAINHTLGIT